MISVLNDVNCAINNGATSHDLNRVQRRLPIFSSSCDYSSKFYANSTTTLHSKSQQQHEQIVTSTINAFRNWILIDPSSPIFHTLSSSSSSTSISPISYAYFSQFSMVPRPRLSFLDLAQSPSRSDGPYYEDATLKTNSTFSLSSTHDGTAASTSSLRHICTIPVANPSLNPFRPSSLPAISTSVTISHQSSRISNPFFATKSLHSMIGGPLMLVLFLRDLLTLTLLRFIPSASSPIDASRIASSLIIKTTTQSSCISNRHQRDCRGKRDDARRSDLKLCSKVFDFAIGKPKQINENDYQPSTTSQSFICSASVSRSRSEPSPFPLPKLSSWVFVYVAFAAISVALCSEELSKKLVNNG